MSNSLFKLIIIGFTILNISNNVYAQNTFVDLILGDMYGKSKLEVYEYLKSFPFKNDTGALDFTSLEALKEESMKADEIVYLGLNGLIYLDEKESSGISIYFYLGRAYRVTISGDWAWDSLLNELTARLGKGKIKKIKLELMGVSVTNLYSWNTKEYKVEYHDGQAYPSSLEVIYKPIFTTIQKPVLKIFMQNGSGDLRPYQVEWSADSNNVTNGCSSLHRLELLGNVKDLCFVIQCLNGNEVYREDIVKSKGKKVILTYNDLPEGCEPIIAYVISPNENLYSTRYVFKLLEGEYEHFSGSLHLDDCRD